MTPCAKGTNPEKTMTRPRKRPHPHRPDEHSYTTLPGTRRLQLGQVHLEGSNAHARSLMVNTGKQHPDPSRKFYAFYRVISSGVGLMPAAAEEFAESMSARADDAVSVRDRLRQDPRSRIRWLRNQGSNGTDPCQTLRSPLGPPLSTPSRTSSRDAQT